MDANIFIERIRAAGFRLKVDGGELTVRPADKLTGAQVAFIRQHKPSIIAALTGKPVLAAAADLATVREWLDRIGETDQGVIDEVMAKVEADPEAMAFYLDRAVQHQDHPVRDDAGHGDAEAIRAAILAGWVWDRGQWFEPGSWTPPEPVSAPEAPADQGRPIEVGTGIRCEDCQHQEPTEHPMLIRCGAERDALAACGMWWKSDPRSCPKYRRAA